MMQKQGACSRSQASPQVAAAVLLLALIVCSLGLTAASRVTPWRSTLAATAATKPPSQYLYVWAGAANASLARDSLFVISLKAGKEFGQLLTVVETPWNGLEPHHCRPSVDGHWLACSGLLATLSGLPSILFFDLTNPAMPVLMHNVSQPVLSTCADEFAATPDGGFLVTMMGNAAHASPGRVARYDRNLELVGEYPEGIGRAVMPGFNPHGVGVDFIRSTMVTSDYVEPVSVLEGHNLTFRRTARLWSLTNMSITATFELEGAMGAMDAVAVGDTGHFFFTGGNGRVYHVDPSLGPNPKAEVVYDINSGATISCILQPFRNGTRLLVAFFAQSKVMLFNTVDPRNIKLLDTWQMPQGTGGHVLRMTADERMAILGTYFLEIGQLHHPGDCTVRMLRLDARGNKFVRDKWPHKRGPIFNFTSILPGKGGFRPHGVAIL